MIMMTNAELYDMRAASAERRVKDLPWTMEEVRVLLITVGDLLDSEGDGHEGHGTIIDQATSMISRASLSLYRCGMESAKGYLDN